MEMEERTKKNSTRKKEVVAIREATRLLTFSKWGKKYEIANFRPCSRLCPFTLVFRVPHNASLTTS